MEVINTAQNYNEEKYNYLYNTNNNNNQSFHLRLDRSFDNINNRRNRYSNYTCYNITSENNDQKSNPEKYNNIHQISESSQKNLEYQDGHHCCEHLCHFINHCFVHPIHFHHIHIPHNDFCPHLNNSVSQKRISNSKLYNDDLLNQITELRNDCRKFKA